MGVGAGGEEESYLPLITFNVVHNCGTKVLYY